MKRYMYILRYTHQVLIWITLDAKRVMCLIDENDDEYHYSVGHVEVWRHCDFLNDEAWEVVEL